MPKFNSIVAKTLVKSIVKDGKTIKISVQPKRRDGNAQKLLLKKLAAM
jgi:hypothetical protein